ncbi:MAG: glycoside hydrolase family 36 protein [Bryobacteraceae bacterium]
MRKFALSLLLFSLFPAEPSSALAADPPLDLRRTPGEVAGAHQIKLIRQWKGDLCRSRLINRGKAPVRIKEVVLFRVKHSLPPATALYAESFQMLSQTAGTLGHPVNIGYDERRHYRIPQPDDATAVTGMLTLTPPGGETILLGFTSCRRFNGRFYLRPGSIEVVLDTENLELAPGESWELEEFLFAHGPVRPALLNRLANEINRNHPPLRVPRPPTGWCSWYHFGRKVTAQNVLDNLDAIAKSLPELRYVQIDHGYEPAIGDWLETGTAFGGDVRSVLKTIRNRGFEPAIWVAPFVAEPGSHLFQQHPDWFMKDSSGKPLPSGEVTFQGWENGPWYALDGTHPEAQRYLENLFRTMRRQWGASYFKLDANFWGAMHGAKLHDPKATRIEAYRRGMEAILRGAGDCFVLGCNHPIWASFGLIHGSRSSADISRDWRTFAKLARQNLSRNWQNGKLWWNDPDAVVLTGKQPEKEFRFHATMILASGGMILSGDDLSQIPPDRLAMLRKLLPPTQTAAEFTDETLRVGVVKLPDRDLVCVFNYTDAPESTAVQLPRAGIVTELWSGENLGRKSGVLQVDVPARSAKVLVLH